MIIDIPSNLKLPPNLLYNKGVSGRFNVEFESDFDAVIYFAGKSPIAKGKTQKPLMEWLMSLGISFDDIKSHRKKILDVIRQLTDIDSSSNYVTVPPIPQSFSVKPVKDKKKESKLEEKKGLEENKNLDALLDSIRNEESEEKNLDALLDSIRNEKPEDKKIDPNKLLSVKTFKNPLKGQKFTAPVIKSSVKNIKADQLKSAVKIEPEKLIPDNENVSEELIEKIDELIFVIKADNALEKDQQNYIKKQEERKKREKREQRIELKKVFGIDRTTKKAIKKVKDIFDSIIRFLTFTVLGQIVKFVTDFLRNPKNKEFIDNVINFVRSIPEKLKQAREKIQPVIDFFTGMVTKVKKFAEDFRLLIARFPFLGQFFATEKEKEEGIPSSSGVTIFPEQGVPLPNVGPMGFPGFFPLLGTSLISGGVLLGDAMLGTQPAAAGTFPQNELLPGYKSSKFYISPEERKMLDAISGAEGTGAGYGTLYGGEYIPELGEGKMTISDVLRMQTSGLYRGKNVYA